MNRQMIRVVCEQIYRRFPEVAGSQPKVEKRPDEQSLLIFRGASKTADGKAINRIVRVVVSQTGKITKVTSSR